MFEESKDVRRFWKFRIPLAESIQSLKTINVNGSLAQYGLGNKKSSDKISVFLFGEYISTHPKLSFEGIIAHIMLQYFLLIHFLSKTSENHKILLRFYGGIKHEMGLMVSFAWNKHSIWISGKYYEINITIKVWK